MATNTVGMKKSDPDGLASDETCLSWSIHLNQKNLANTVFRMKTIIELWHVISNTVVF